MKKQLYLCLCAVLLFVSAANAQYSIIGFNYRTFPCAMLSTTVTVSGSASGLKIRSVWGDGSSDTVNAPACPANHVYNWPGTYTISQYLFLGSVVYDSISYSAPIVACNYFSVAAFIDANSNCTFDVGEHMISQPATVEVDSAGTPIDTVVWASQYMRACPAPSGTIFAYKLLSPPSGATLTCPPGGILYDTVSTTTHITKYFAFQCTPSSSFDAMEMVSTSATTTVTVGTGPAGASTYRAFISLLDNSCSPHTDTFTLTFSPKYAISSASPALASVVGNVATWVLPGLSITTGPTNIHVTLRSIVPLALGDTLHNKFVISPLAGDTNPANNTINTVDTIRHAWDPNEKRSSPEGLIAAGTQLQYTIRFENMGNDTAHNIYVMDTLSDLLDARSLNVIAASANVVTISNKIGALNIVKFNFPHINLPDSSHHDQCDGMVVFTINAKAGLPDGTLINNRAGIYFDDNPVVMTNTATNVIGVPPPTTIVMSNIAGVNIYPNPVNEELTVSIDNGSYNKLTITNTLGQSMISQEFSGAKTNINVKMLPAGIYYITLRGDNGIKVQRFVKM